MNKLRDKEKWKNVGIDLLFSVVGSALVALATAVFNVPNDIAPGGATGLSTALAHITPIRVSVWSIIINVPLLICAWHMLGLYSLTMTLISTVLLSGFIEICELIPKYTSNVLFAAVFGGVITGIGVGILFLRGISTGGTDLLALILKKIFPNVGNGTLLMILDVAVVAIAVLVFRDLEVALYSAVSIVVGTKVIDAIAEGVDYAKVIYVITNKGQEVSAALNTYTDRGTTIVPATGGYTGEGKQMIITVTRRNMLSQTLKIIKMTDPDAFSFVMDSTEVHGEGFKQDKL